MAWRGAQRLAAEHADVIATLRATMAAHGVKLPANHFLDPDVELARYAVTVGLLTAQSEEDRCRRMRSLFWPLTGVHHGA